MDAPRSSTSDAVTSDTSTCTGYPDMEVKKEDLTYGDKVADRDTGYPDMEVKKEDLTDGNKVADRDTGYPDMEVKKEDLSDSDKVADRDTGYPDMEVKKEDLTDGNKVADRDTGYPDMEVKKEDLTDGNKVADRHTGYPDMEVKKKDLTDGDKVADRDTGYPDMEVKKEELSDSDKMADRHIDYPDMEIKKEDLTDNDIVIKQEDLTESDHVAEWDIGYPDMEVKKEDLTDNDIVIKQEELTANVVKSQSSNQTTRWKLASGESYSDEDDHKSCIPTDGRVGWQNEGEGEKETDTVAEDLRSWMYCELCDENYWDRCLNHPTDDTADWDTSGEQKHPPQSLSASATADLTPQTSQQQDHPYCMPPASDQPFMMQHEQRCTCIVIAPTVIAPTVVCPATEGAKLVPGPGTRKEPHTLTEQNKEVTPVTAHSGHNMEPIRVEFEDTFLHQSPVCEKTFGSKSRCVRHIRVHTGETPFKCLVCNQGFNQPGSYMSHMQRHPGKKTFQCEICGQEFNHFTNYKIHFEKHKTVGTEEDFNSPLSMPSASDKHKHPPQSLSASATADSTPQTSLQQDHCRPPTSGEQCVNHHVPRPEVVARKCPATESTALVPCPGTREEPHTVTEQNKEVTPVPAHSGHNMEPIRVKSGDSVLHQCPVCDNKFEGKSRCVRHIRSHTGERPFKCKVCGRGFSESGNYKRHMRRHTGEQPYKCEVCGQGFSQSGNYKIHMQRRHTGEQLYKGPEVVARKCPATESTALVPCPGTREEPHTVTEQNKEVTPVPAHSGHNMEPIRVKTGDSVLHQCPVCDNKFEGKSRCVRHIRVHTGERPFKCKVCGRGFSESGNYKRHMRRHTGEQPYKCEVCGQGFSQSGNYKIHMRRHTGEQPYKRPEVVARKCPATEGAKLTPGPRTREEPHTLTEQNKEVTPFPAHSGQNMKPIRVESGDTLLHQCPVCDKTFGSKTDCVRHICVHTGEKPFKCKLCGLGFSHSSSYKTHMRRHTGEKPYKCEVCGQGFSQSGSIKRHIRTHTGEKPFMCEVCGWGFGQSHAFNRHMQTHTMGKRLKY